MKSEVLLWCLSVVSCAKNEEKLRKRKEKSQREFIRPRITKEPIDKIAKWDETSKFDFNTVRFHQWWHIFWTVFETMILKTQRDIDMQLPENRAILKCSTWVVQFQARILACRTSPRISGFEIIDHEIGIVLEPQLEAVIPCGPYSFTDRVISAQRPFTFS